MATGSSCRECAEVGGLIAYEPNTRDFIKRVAALVDKAVNNARPGDPPIERPTSFEPVINLRAAKTVGLAIPPSGLARADKASP